MAELKIYLSDGLNEKFRRIAMSVYGYGRGSLSKAAEDAFTRWCSEREPSSGREKVAGKLETTQRNSSKQAESHVNPDERQNVDQEVKGLGQDPAANSIG
ncbi:MAG TPA: hypothetical protein VNA15_08005 [Candidatus Angelobacter sp.]|nr:hypothetical protein [Candidatus Angelobacter sp.]